MSEPGRPLPLPDADSAPFWEACARGELVMQRCAQCQALRFPPRPMCPRCRSLESAWSRVSGRGVVYSFVVCHPPVLAAFRSRVPYPVVLIALAEDPTLRLVGGLEGCAPEALRIGLPVAVRFEQAAEDVWLPLWRPADPASGASQP